MPRRNTEITGMPALDSVPGAPNLSGLQGVFMIYELTHRAWRGLGVLAMFGRLGAMTLFGGLLQFAGELERRGREGRSQRADTAWPAAGKRARKTKRRASQSMRQPTEKLR
jgi:hypothetical protein